MDKPLESVYSFVERTYVRLQAGDLLTRCMDDGSKKPIEQLVESLVLAGPQSMQALREILSETDHRRVQLRDDQHQLVSNHSMLDGDSPELLTSLKFRLRLLDGIEQYLQDWLWCLAYQYMHEAEEYTIKKTPASTLS